MTTTAAPAPATHALKVFTLCESWTDVEEHFANHADAEQSFVDLLESEGWGCKEHPEGGWVCFDDKEETVAVLIVKL